MYLAKFWNDASATEIQNFANNPTINETIIDP